MKFMSLQKSNDFVRKHWQGSLGKTCARFVVNRVEECRKKKWRKIEKGTILLNVKEMRKEEEKHNNHYRKWKERWVLSLIMSSVCIDCINWAGRSKGSPAEQLDSQIIAAKVLSKKKSIIKEIIKIKAYGSKTSMRNKNFWRSRNNFVKNIANYCTSQGEFRNNAWKS